MISSFVSVGTTARLDEFGQKGRIAHIFNWKKFARFAEILLQAARDHPEMGLRNSRELVHM
jgi:hypothetical protein